VLPDFLPLIQNREVLNFRWTPDTPRSSLRRSIGQAVAVTPVVEQTVDPSPSVDANSKDDTNKSGRGVRWDESVVCNEDKNKRQLPRSRSQKETRDSAASRQRAEYVKQKIQEQEEIQRREQEIHSNASTAVTAAPALPVALDDPFVASVPAKTTLDTTQVSPPLHHDGITKEDLMASGSSPPKYSSPTPRLPSTNEEEQQTSSPLASPTRDIRGARKTDHSVAWMMGLGAEKQQQQPIAAEDAKDDLEAQTEETAARGVEDEEVEAFHDTVDLTGEEVSISDQMAVDAPVQQESLTATNHDELEEERAVEQATSPQKKQEVSVKDIPAYQTMKSVVNQLRSHPSNQWFRQPCPEDLHIFCKERNRPVVDLYTISNAITLGEYGLDEPLKHFKSDLDQMWNNIRTFYPPQSQQSHCASMLETFSGILLEEWKRNSNAAARKAHPLKPRPNSTPMSRLEKRPLKPTQDGTPKTQQQAYFASLVAKAGLVASRSPSGTQASKMGNPLKRSAPLSAASRWERPAKKAAQTSPLSVPAPVLSIADENTVNVTTASKVLEVAPRLMTRGLAKQAAA
jgi:hypothetical protein